MKTFEQWRDECGHIDPQDTFTHSRAKGAWNACAAEYQQAHEEWFHLRRDDEIARLKSRVRDAEEVIKFCLNGSIMGHPDNLKEIEKHIREYQKKHLTKHTAEEARND